jgi:UDP-N-acetylmuramoylalanine--D-glutamate ligase
VLIAGRTIVRRTANGDEPLVPLSSVKLLGPHLVADVLAAAAVSSLAGVDAVAMTRAVESFTGLEHALEPVTEVGGVRFVNDSKATNVAAALRGLAAYAEPLHLILGGSLKGESFAPLARAIRERGGLRSILLVGEAGDELAAALDTEGLANERAGTLGRAVSAAVAAARDGDVVLLSPACASYDQFANFEERGDEFRRLVAAL